MDPRNWLFDKRVLRRNLDKGIISVAEYKKHMKSMQDLGEECEEIDLSLSAGGDEAEVDENEAETES